MLDNDDKYFTSDSNYLTFIAPSLTTVRDTDRHQYSTYTWGYDMALRITGRQEIVTCYIQNRCLLYYSYTYTPFISDIFQPTQISDNRLNFRVMRQNGLNIQRQTQSGQSPLRHIKIQSQNCDYVSHDLITPESYTHKWRYVSYYCDLTDFKHVKNAKFQHRDYTGDALVLEQTHFYLFDGTRSLMKIFPTINYISHHSGNIGGGLELTVKGTGWDRDNTKIYVDGMECPLIGLPTFDADDGDFEVKCKTKAAPVSSGQAHAGGHGIYRQLYDYKYLTQVQGATVTERRIAINAEIPYYEEGYAARRYSSIQKKFFKPPVAGNKRYRFRTSQDDICNVYIYDQQPNKIAANKADMTVALQNVSWNSLRYFYQFYDEDNDKFQNVSPWFTLNSNNLYYMETWMQNTSGGSFCILGVEIDHQVSDHPQNVPDVQRLSYTYNPTFDEYKVKLHKTGKPVDSVFKLVFKVDGEEGQVNFPVENLTLDMTTSEYKTKLNAYFSKKFGTTNYNVFKSYTMANGSPATGADDAAKLTNADYVEFLIRMKNLHEGPRESQTNYPVIQSGVLNVGNSEAKYTQGDYPMKGKWRIKVTDPYTNELTTSTDLSHGAQYYHVTDALGRGVHDFLHKTMCIRKTLTDEDGAEKGFQYTISFDFYRKDVPQMELDLSDLYWQSPAGVVNGVLQLTNNTNFQKTKETLQEFSKNLLFIPAPYQFFRSAHTKPQVTIVSGGLLGVCDWNRTVSSERCDFEYKASTSQVTSFSANGDFTQVTLAGSSLDSGAISKRSWAGSECANYNPATNVCSISSPKAGSFKPEIFETNLGFATVSAAAVDIPPLVSSVQPTTVFQQGGQTLAITGSRFPTDDSVLVSITIGGEECDGYRLVSETKIECETPEQATTGSKKVVVIVGGVSSTDNVNVQVGALTTQATINPNSARSTEKKNLDITITGMSQSETDVTKYSASLKNAKHHLRMKVNSHSYTGGNNVITVRFPGGFMGDYELIVQHDDYGTLESSATFRIGAKVTAVSPKTGSAGGGTLVTVTGEDFDTEKSFIYFGYRKCETVGTPTTTQLQCMSPISTKKDENGKLTDDEVQIAVVTDITDDVTCATTGACRFRWQAAKTSEVTASTITGNTITITGTFTAGGNYEVMLGGISQQVGSVTASTIPVTLIELSTQYTALALTVREVNKGYALITSAASKITPPIPVFNLQQPHIASQGGTEITITGDYFPKDYKGQLKKGSTKICLEVEYVSKVQMKCVSRAFSTGNGSTHLYSVDKKSVGCGTCFFKTDSSLNSEITSLTSSYTGTTLTVVFTGTSFPHPDQTATVKIGDISASTAVIDSASQITATFVNGVGFVKNAAIHAMFSTKHKAVSDQVSYTQNLTNAAVSGAVQCSFAGGCEVTFTGTNIGLDQHLGVSLNGYPCSYTWNSASITQNELKCILPAFPTKHSAGQYPELSESIIWHSSKNVEITQTSVTNANNAFDQDAVSESDSSGQCMIGLKTINNHVGTIESVRFQLSRNPDINKYLGGVFEVSDNAGTTWTPLYKVESPPREGWNTMDANCAAPTSATYNTVRFRPIQKGGCDFVSLEIKGKLMHSSDANSIALTAVISRLGEQVATVENAATYSEANTPKVTGVSTKYVNINQATVFTISGSKFGTVKENVAVRINGKDQTVTSVSEGSIAVTSVTNCNPANKETKFEVEVKNKGKAVIQGHMVLCTYYWNDDNIWSGEFAPGLGDSVVIPKGMHLIMNADIVPQLRAVIVQGSLIFLPHDDKTKTRYFNADYIYVDGGYLEIGTESKPYNSKFQLTLYGEQTSASIPIYGNKVLACRYCTLDIHGVNPNKSWLELYQTVNAGDSEIILNTTDDIDWAVGDQIVIAPTSFDFKEAEECPIKEKGKDSGNRIKLKLECTLKYQHYAGTTSYGQDSLEMRAEVGLLTRNVKIQGDPSSRNNKYGAHIMVHSPGDETSVARIENTEFMDVGQGFKLGRYPIHFHRIGFVRNSYIKRNSVHHTYNRAVTVHGVHCLTVEDNVAYHTMGHTYFIEDAIETRNILKHNLAVRSGPSNSLLNTDTTPASFWITNPNNQFIDNHAAGSMRYGFWFDLQKHSTGPSESEHICPVGEKLGKFDGNVAHSNGRYGLRIFDQHIPRTKPCDPVMQSVASNQQSSDFSEDLAFTGNPSIPALYQNYLGYKNGRCAIIAQKIGALQFKNIKAADNKQAGIEITLPGYSKLADGFVDNALIVGFSANTKDNTQSGTYRGINTGQRDSFIFRNIKFYNFDGNSVNTGASAFGTCSHCSFTLDGEGFANTYEVQGLTFTNTTKRIHYTKDKTIFFDKDGSLSGKGSKTWLTKSHPHLLGSNCEVLDANYDTSISCSKPILKLLLYNPNPKNTLQGMELKVVKLEDIPTTPNGSSEPAWDTTSLAKVSQISQNKKMIIWEVQFVAGREYHVHWRHGIDWEGISIKRTRFYNSVDARFLLHFNFTDRRDEFQVKGRQVIANLTAGVTLTPSSSYQFGTHINNPVTKLFSMIVNEKPEDNGLTGDSSLVITTKRCSGDCFSQAPPSEIETIQRFWSNPNDWRDDPGNSTQTGVVPTAGSIVTIKNTWNMFYDIDTNPLHYDKIFVEGRLTFSDPVAGNKQFELIANQILVVVGEIRIGSQISPYKNKAIITLKGTRNSPSFAYSNNVLAGNKILFVSGNFTAYGSLPTTKVQSRLKAKAVKGATTIQLEPGLQWAPGSHIAIAPTSYDPSQHDMVEIEEYNDATGATVLKSGLVHPHFGAQNAQTYGDFTYDLRAEVALLTRNVVIRGDQGRWGGQMLVAEWRNVTSELIYFPRTILQNVELSRMGQYDTFNSGLRATNLEKGFLHVLRSSIHSSQAIAVFVSKSHNVQMNHTVIYGTYRNGIIVRGSTKLILDHNLVMNNKERVWDSSIKLKDFQTAVDICVGEQNSKCHNFTITNNRLTGGYGIGFTAPVQSCGTNQNSYFLDNVVHSYEAGYIAHIDSVQGAGQCGNITRFQAYHNYELGIQSIFNFKELKVSKIVAVDNEVSLNLGLARGDTPLGTVEVEDSLIIGEHSGSLDCQVQQEKGNKKVGILSTYGIVSAISLPYDFPQLGFMHLGADATRGKLSTVKKVTFAHFNNRGCNVDAKLNAFHIHPEGSDLIMEQIFQQVKFDTVKYDNLIYLMDPPSGWATLDNCGDFPCTAPLNILITFLGTNTPVNSPTFSNLKSSPFQVIHQDGAAPSYCEQYTPWNAQICEGQKLATLQFESLDGDKRDRSVQPIYVRDSDEFETKLNSFMDHVWDGFYTGQIRLSRFTSLIHHNPSETYKITYTGTPPLDQLFEVYGSKSEEFFKLSIDYPNPDLVHVRVGGSRKTPNPLVNGVAAALDGDECGENRWIPVQSILEFTIQGGDSCTITLDTVNSVQLTFRVQQTIDEFFSSGGEDQFITNLSAALGINTSRIRILGVYPGSVVIASAIEPSSSSDPESQQEEELRSIASNVQDKVNNGELNLGAPILDFSAQVRFYAGGVIPPPPDDEDGDNPKQTSPGLKMWHIAVMVIASIALVTVILVIVTCVIRRKKKQVFKVKEITQGKPSELRKIPGTSMDEVIIEDGGSKMTTKKDSTGLVVPQAPQSTDRQPIKSGSDQQVRRIIFPPQRKGSSTKAAWR